MELAHNQGNCRFQPEEPGEPHHQRLQPLHRVVFEVVNLLGENCQHSIRRCATDPGHCFQDIVGKRHVHFVGVLFVLARFANLFQTPPTLCLIPRQWLQSSSEVLPETLEGSGDFRESLPPCGPVVQDRRGKAPE